MNKMKNKKGVFFSLDALIALTIILLTILVVFPLIKYSQKENLIQSDILKVLSSLTIGELANTDSYVQGLIDSGKITNVNLPVLDQIGEFYIIEEDIAKTIANSVLSSINTSENIGIWYGPDLLASRSITSFENSNQVDIRKQLISGIRNASEVGSSATAFSARAFLTSGIQTKYFYFGGYVGDGNISVKIEYDGTLQNVDLEIATNTDFTICVDGSCSGHFEAASSDSEPKSFNSLGLPLTGDNIITFVPIDSETNLHITGGFLKIIYDNSVQYEQRFKYNFPGIEGVINLYDSFYIPGDLNDMSVHLHYKSPYEMFLNIGNVTVFNGTNDGSSQETIPNEELISKGLNYDFLSDKTIPLRMGLSNASYILSVKRDADVFSVTDLSGSMCECTDSYPNSCKYNQLNCESSSSCDAGATCTAGIYEAKDANNLFINLILNNSDNHVGLVGYNTDAYESLVTGLSNNNDSLTSFVENNWFAGEPNIYTCICCGINRAMNGLTTDPGWDQGGKYNSIVVMSDGQANRCCSGFDDYTGSSWGCSSTDAEQDAIDSACYAYNTYGIIVHSIGFGPSADEDTLRDIANCGQGIYNYGDINDIIETYEQIAQEILEASYYEQTIEVTGEFNNTILYPDSYISFNYTSEEIPYGLITTIQTEDFGNTETTGSFFVPDDAEIIEANVISYSSSKWTDNVYIYNDSDWRNIFSLSSYGVDYLNLGDPYVVNLPLDYLKFGDNQVKITSGVSPTNSSGSSASDKAIYTILRSASSYSDISAFADGCVWNLQFEDDTNLTVNIPLDYSGSDTCYYTEENHEAPAIGKDAIQSAVYNLLELLDFQEPKNGKLDVKFTEQDLQIDSSEISGIPYDYSVEVQIRKWS